VRHSLFFFRREGKGGREGGREGVPLRPKTETTKGCGSKELGVISLQQIFVQEGGGGGGRRGREGGGGLEVGHEGGHFGQGLPWGRRREGGGGGGVEGGREGGEEPTEGVLGPGELHAGGLLVEERKIGEEPLLVSSLEARGEEGREGGRRGREGGRRGRRTGVIIGGRGGGREGGREGTAS